MDLLFFLDDKLRFIERHYDRAVEPFATVKRRIENGEPPYEPDTDYDSGEDEPPFTPEWIEADESENIVGYSCLGLVQGVLLEYLREYLRQRGLSLPSGKGGLLQRYRDFFKVQLGIAWDDSPVAFETLEDVAMARNHIQHETNITSRFAQQSDNYAQRFPMSLFGGNFREIRVTDESLKAAISAVEAFCTFIEHQKESRSSLNM